MEMVRMAALLMAIESYARIRRIATDSASSEPLRFRHVLPVRHQHTAAALPPRAMLPLALVRQPAATVSKIRSPAPQSGSPDAVSRERIPRNAHQRDHGGDEAKDDGADHPSQRGLMSLTAPPHCSAPPSQPAPPASPTPASAPSPVQSAP